MSSTLRASSPKGRILSTRAAGRSCVWIKVKLTQQQEFVIGGYTQPEGRRKLRRFDCHSRATQCSATAGSLRLPLASRSAFQKLEIPFSTRSMTHLQPWASPYISAATILASIDPINFFQKLSSYVDAHVRGETPVRRKIGFTNRTVWAQNTDRSGDKFTTGQYTTSPDWRYVLARGSC